MGRLALLSLCTLVMSPMLASCGSSTALPQSETAVNLVRGDFAGSSDSEQWSNNKIPGFYFFNENIYEYARSAAGNTPPLRQTSPPGIFFGADKNGQAYSYTPLSDAECRAPCRVFVSDALGSRKRTITIPTLGTAYHPSSLFVDRNGSIYYILECSVIVQLPAGASGSNPKPARTLNMPINGCMGSNRFNIVNQVFAASNGNLFMNGPYKNTAAYFNWPGTASGKTKPRLIITGLAQRPILGIDSKGGAWTIGTDLTTSTAAAFEIGPKDSGRVSLAPLVLLGVSALGMLRVARNDELVYEGLRGSSNSPVLLISSPQAGKPVRRLNLPGGFVGSELTSVTF